MNIGIDLGGHTISAALVTEMGRIASKLEIGTEASRDPEAVIGSMVDMVKTLSRGEHCSSVGIGIPGMIDRDREHVFRLPNFPGWDGIGIKDILQEKISIPVLIENDANCYALGEGIAGNAVGVDDYAVFTLGTGIGGGIILGGMLLTGAHGMAGEFGHIAVAEEGKCGCGAFGHVETVSAADGIESAAGKIGLSENVAALWKKRHEVRLWPVWDRALNSLARAISSVVHILDLEVIILGGGMSRAEGLLDELQPYIARYTAPVFRQYTRIEISRLGNDASLIGAASLADH